MQRVGFSSAKVVGVCDIYGNQDKLYQVWFPECIIENTDQLLIKLDLELVHHSL